MHLSESPGKNSGRDIAYKKQGKETAAKTPAPNVAGASPQETRVPARLLENRVLESFGGAKANDCLGLDLNRFARGGIAAHARLAMRLDRAPDAGNDELARALGFLNGQIEQLIEKRGDLLFRNGLVLGADLVGHVGDDLRLAQRSCHRVAFSSLKEFFRSSLVGTDAL